MPAAQAAASPTAVVLGVGRAIGEAMAIIMVAGNVSQYAGAVHARALPHHRHRLSEMSYAASAACSSRRCYSIALVLFLFIMLINAVLNLFIKKRKGGLT